MDIEESVEPDAASNNPHHKSTVLLQRHQMHRLTLPGGLGGGGIPNVTGLIQMLHSPPDAALFLHSLLTGRVPTFGLVCVQFLAYFWSRPSTNRHCTAPSAGLCSRTAG